MSKRILSVSYDVALLATRRMMLEQKGYRVTSALGFTSALEACNRSHYDLFILGHSIPAKDKTALIDNFRENCNAPILSLERTGEERVHCDFHASPDNPEELLEKVDGILKLLDTSQGSKTQGGNAQVN
jgi:DNA-binding response OmpR family regulator